MSFSLLFSILLFMDSSFQAAGKVTGQQVLQKMHGKYAGKFDPYFTFDQTAVLYKTPSDSTTQVWHEALALPGKLVIKFENFESGNGAIYAQDSQYVFKDHVLQNRRPRVHELLVLAFDVYHQPVSRSMAQLQQAGIDLSKSAETTHQGRKVYLVGAPNGNHFIIDQKKLWLLQTVRKEGEQRMVVDLKGYQNVQGNWVATDLTFTLNGKPMMHEVYYNMRFPKSLPESIFTVQGFDQARW